METKQTDMKLPKKTYKCLLGLHTWTLFNYDGYGKIYYCEKCEKVKSIRIKKRCN